MVCSRFPACGGGSVAKGTPVTRLIIGFALAAGIYAGAGTALAAQPVQQACMGTTVSSGAQAIQPYGAVVSGFAQVSGDGNRPGVGDDIQLLQAGAIPDSVFPNTCN